MPRLNARGDVLAGIAGAVTSINNVPIVPGRCCGDWEWLTNDVAAGQVCDSSTSGACAIQDALGNVLINEGAYHFAAGGGRWASRLNSLRSNFLADGPEFSDAIPLKGSLEGDIALLMNYSAGANPRIYLATGEQMTLPVTLQKTDPFSLRDGLVTFTQSGVGWRVFDYRAGVEVPYVRMNDSDYMVAVRAGGAVYLFERLTADASLRVRRSDSSAGLIVGTWQGPGRETFQPDMVALDSETLVVAWGWTQGENAGEVEWKHVRTADVNAAAIPVPPSVPGPLAVQVVTRAGAVVTAPEDVRTALAGALAGSSMGGEDVRTILIIVGAVLLALAWGE